MDKVSIGGIELFAARDQQALIEYLFEQQEIRTGSLIAINAEKVILNLEDEELRALIANVAYKYADGMSVVCTIRGKYPEHSQIKRIAGADLWEALMREASKRKLPVFLLGSSENILNETAIKLKQWNINIVGSQNGYFEEIKTEQVIQHIKVSGAKLVTVAMGSPKQEQFIQKALQIYPDALYMGVGGTYDVFVGKVKRAPKSWQNMGLEWLYRLLHQPTRWKRVIRLIKYAYLHLRNQL